MIKSGPCDDSRTDRQDHAEVIVNTLISPFLDDASEPWEKKGAPPGAPHEN
jgi:hypothetical protein